MEFGILTGYELTLVVVIPRKRRQSRGQKLVLHMKNLLALVQPKINPILTQLRFKTVKYHTQRIGPRKL